MISNSYLAMLPGPVLALSEVVSVGSEKLIKGISMQYLINRHQLRNANSKFDKEKFREKLLKVSKSLIGVLTIASEIFARPMI